MTSSTEEEKDFKSLAEVEQTLYSLEAFQDGYSTVKVPLHEKIKNASYCMQCESPKGFEDSGLTHISCALGKCEKCRTYPRPAAEVELGDNDKKHGSIHTKFFQHAQNTDH